MRTPHCRRTTWTRSNGCQPLSHGARVPSAPARTRTRSRSGGEFHLTPCRGRRDDPAPVRTNRGQHLDHGPSEPRWQSSRRRPRCSRTVGTTTARPRTTREAESAGRCCCVDHALPDDASSPGGAAGWKCPSTDHGKRVCQGSWIARVDGRQRCAARVSQQHLDTRRGRIQGGNPALNTVLVCYGRGHRTDRRTPPRGATRRAR